jgi:hypothetical protein
LARALADDAVELVVGPAGTRALGADVDAVVVDGDPVGLGPELALALRHRVEAGLPLLALGGALADLGVYCLDPLLVAGGGTPRSLAAQRVDATSGVDATFAGWLTFDEGFATSFACSFEAPEHQSLER